MRLRNTLALLIFAIGVLAAGLWATAHHSAEYFLAEAQERGRTSLNLYAENIRGWLGRYRALPRIYAQNPDVLDFLNNPDNELYKATVNAYLTDGNLATGASDTYLLDRHGTAIAASNWADPVTFVGNNYSYRPYYTNAMNGELGQFFALGTASLRRGYYYSYPVRDGAEIIGVTVVKIGVDEIESELEQSTDEVFVTDPEKVVLLSANPDWRLKTLVPLDEAAVKRISENRQFDLDTLSPIGSFGSQITDGNGQIIKAMIGRTKPDEQELLHLSTALDDGWTLHMLVDTGFARNQVLTTVFLVGSILLGFGLVITIIWQRRKRLVDLLVERERAHSVLERTVQERTADLSASNLRLEAEVDERKAAEAELRQTQHELIQAGKLAGLGQMSAALSHEFNQPIAAIRTYADNAGLFLDRGREAEARENIGHIAGLTERMAGLSKHLSSFARKPQATIRPVSLNAIVNETLGLLKGRLSQAGIDPVIDMPADEVFVSGGHIRLQQVLVNLITNAIDAMKAVDQPSLFLSVSVSEGRVRLIVEDNGSGLPEEAAGQVFDPFFTTKDVGQGLGLGLSISYNIIKDFGGSISAVNRETAGARFILDLVEATPSKGEEAAE